MKLEVEKRDITSGHHLVLVSALTGLFIGDENGEKR